MGFIRKKEYTIENLGITIPEAYAKIERLLIDNDGNAHATFNIHQSRENTNNKIPLERKTFSVIIDKTLPIYSQVYISAKNEIFSDWEDDIVTDSEE